VTLSAEVGLQVVEEEHGRMQGCVYAFIPVGMIGWGTRGSRVLCSLAVSLSLAV
jgi:hypothetical protein